MRLRGIYSIEIDRVMGEGSEHLDQTAVLNSSSMSHSALSAGRIPSGPIRA